MATTTQQNTTTDGNHEASGAAAAAGEMFEQAKKKVGEVATKAKDEVGHQLEAQKDRAVGNLGGVADALRSTSQQLRQGEHGGMTGYVDAAAEQVDKLSGYLKDKDLGQMVHEVEAFARREPALFLGGAFTIGLLASRFLKSSSRSANVSYDRYGQPAFDDADTAPYGSHSLAAGNHGGGYAGAGSSSSRTTSSYDSAASATGYNRDRTTQGSPGKMGAASTSSASSPAQSKPMSGNGNGNGNGNGGSAASNPSSSGSSMSGGGPSSASSTTATTSPATPSAVGGSGGMKKS